MKKEGTLVSLLEKSVNNFSSRIAIRSQLTEGLEWTYEELYENSRKVAGALREQGIEKGDRIAIICENDGQFVAVKSGAHALGAIDAPVDQNLNPRTQYYDYLKKLRPKLILADENNISKIKEYAENIPIITFEQALNGKYFEPDTEVNSEDISTIIFSSGTTSEPGKAIKGVKLSQGNIASNIIAARELTTLAEKNGAKQGIYLAGLARHWHSFEYMIENALLDTGCLLHFSDIQRFIKGEAACINPHYAIMVPKAANTIMNDIKKKVHKKGYLKYKIFEGFLKHSQDYYYELNNNHKRCAIKEFINSKGDKLFYKAIHEGLEGKLGKNNPFLVGGSAPLSLETQLFFYIIGFPIYQGYGLTETSPALCVNLPDEYRFGSSGKILPGIEVIIADTNILEDKREIKRVEEGKEGLILVKGPNVFKGYLNDEESTRQSFVDGWFNTDDLGYIKEDFLYVTGRNKDLICTNDGNKTNPAPIETYYRAKGLNIILVGNKCDRVGAFIIPGKDDPKDESDLAYRKRICKTILYDSQTNFGKKFSPKNLAHPTDFNKHPELITGVMKEKRKFVEDLYKEKVKDICN
jgi:long-chain acyl-CoA synthetase